LTVLDVYANTGSGFSTSGMAFALPTLPRPLDTQSGLDTGCTGSASQEWSTVDLTGDGKLDLVLTEACADSTVGTSHWSLYSATCAP
jgi:hypothetical protein